MGTAHRGPARPQVRPLSPETPAVPPPVPAQERRLGGGVKPGQKQRFAEGASEKQLGSRFGSGSGRLPTTTLKITENAGNGPCSRRLENLEGSTGKYQVET